MAALLYPTALHKAAIEAILAFFLQQEGVDTVLLANSLARGKATKDSDIDIAVLVNEATDSAAIARLEKDWLQFSASNPILYTYRSSGKFALLHVDVIDGTFDPGIFEEGGGMNYFEVEIGNRLLYSIPLTGEGAYFTKLKSEWLPYYNTTLQMQRLQLAKESCLYDIEHIPVYVNRGLYFHAFDRLYIAFQKFLQALFIKHATYPVAYNKWIKEQLTEILQLPQLYKELPNIISVYNIESAALNSKAEALRMLLEKHC